MDGLLNTCHASLINIQSSPSRKSLLPRPPSPPSSFVSRRCRKRRGEATTHQVESRLIFIDDRVRPRWHLLVGPGRSATGELEFVMARRGSREILEYDKLLLPRNRLPLENRNEMSLWDDHTHTHTHCGDSTCFQCPSCASTCIYFNVNWVEFNVFLLLLYNLFFIILQSVTISKTMYFGKLFPSL